MNTNQTPQKPGIRRARLVRGALTALVVSAVAGGLAAIGSVTEPHGSVLPQPTLPLAVLAEPARQRGGYEVVREFVGVVEARRESPVGFELGGRVAAVLPEEGERIEAGAVIARLDTTILEAERASPPGDPRTGTSGRRTGGHHAREGRPGAWQKNAVSAQSWDEADKDHQARVAALARRRKRRSRPSKRASQRPSSPPRSPLWWRSGSSTRARWSRAGRPVVPPARERRSGGSHRRFRRPRSTPSRSVSVTRFRSGIASVVGKVKSVLPLRGNGTRSVDVILTLDAEFDGIRRGDLVTLDIRTEEERARILAAADGTDGELARPLGLLRRRSAR